MDKCLPDDKCKAYVSDWERVGRADLAEDSLSQHRHASDAEFASEGNYFRIKQRMLSSID